MGGTVQFCMVRKVEVNLPNLNIKLHIVELFRRLSKKKALLSIHGLSQDQGRTSEGVERLYYNGIRRKAMILRTSSQTDFF
jgi:hypothetical protein